LVVALGQWYETQRERHPQHAAEKQHPGRTSPMPADHGPGTLREALFIAAAATGGNATISIEVPRIKRRDSRCRRWSIRTWRQRDRAKRPATAGRRARTERSGPVFDVGGADTSIDGLHIVSCPAAGVLLRAVRFHLQSASIENCDVGVELAENASDTVLEGSQFSNNRVGIRFAAAGHHTIVERNRFASDKDAALWVVGGDAGVRGDPINVHDNQFNEERTAIVAGNIPILVEHNEFTNSHEAAIHLVGAAATIRGNRISGGESMGVVAENARGAIIDNNEIDGFAAYGIMARGSGDTLLRNNRLHNCGYGIAFVLGDANAPGTAVENIIIEPKFNGIDVVGDSPILRRNQVLRAHALALHVENFQPAGGGAKVVAHPFLDNNSFGADAAAAPAGNIVTGDASRRPAQ
jgi:parallel beta-helix repeat protein